MINKKVNRPFLIYYNELKAPYLCHSYLSNSNILQAIAICMIY